VIELSKRLIELMADPRDREHFSRLAGLNAPLLPETPPTAPAAASRLSRWERDEHRQFCAWLELHELPYSHSRTDVRATIQPGLPDFLVAVAGELICIEFKTEGGKLSLEQETWRLRFEAQGIEYHVLTLALEAIGLITRKLLAAGRPVVTS
jgi:VRR-NUC domain